MKRFLEATADTGQTLTTKAISVEVPKNRKDDRRSDPYRDDVTT